MQFSPEYGDEDFPSAIDRDLKSIPDCVNEDAATMDELSNLIELPAVQMEPPAISRARTRIGTTIHASEEFSEVFLPADIRAEVSRVSLPVEFSEFTKFSDKVAPALLLSLIHI